MGKRRTFHEVGESAINSERLHWAVAIHRVRTGSLPVEQFFLQAVERIGPEIMQLAKDKPGWWSNLDGTLNRKGRTNETK